MKLLINALAKISATQDAMEKRMNEMAHRLEKTPEVNELTVSQTKHNNQQQHNSHNQHQNIRNNNQQQSNTYRGPVARGYRGNTWNQNYRANHQNLRGNNRGSFTRPYGRRQR